MADVMDYEELPGKKWAGHEKETIASSLISLFNPAPVDMW
jgi:hypothetical protein